MSARLRWSWLAVLVILVGALAYGTLDDSGPRTDADRVRALSDRIACPQCSGQSVAESDVTIARVIRTDIAERVDAGQTDDEIVAALKASYGDDIDLNPSATGLTGIVWVLPVAVLIGGLALVVALLQRWRRAPPADADADVDPAPGVPPPPPPRACAVGRSPWPSSRWLRSPRDSGWRDPRVPERPATG